MPVLNIHTETILAETRAHEPPEGHHVTEHQGDLCLTEEQRGREVETRALLMWTQASPPELSCHFECLELGTMSEQWSPPQAMDSLSGLGTT